MQCIWLSLGCVCLRRQTWRVLIFNMTAFIIVRFLLLAAVAEFGAWSFILIMDHVDEKVSRKTFLKSCAVTSNPDDETEAETPAKQPPHLTPLAAGCSTPVSVSPSTLDVCFRITKSLTLSSVLRI